jgi:hypothetical protein
VIGHAVIKNALECVLEDTAAQSARRACAPEQVPGAATIATPIVRDGSRPSSTASSTPSPHVARPSRARAQRAGASLAPPPRRRLPAPSMRLALSRIGARARRLTSVAAACMLGV